jgi:hypothetical protein
LYWQHFKKRGWAPVCSNTLPFLVQCSPPFMWGRLGPSRLYLYSLMPMGWFMQTDRQTDRQTETWQILQKGCLHAWKCTVSITYLVRLIPFLTPFLILLKVSRSWCLLVSECFHNHSDNDLWHWITFKLPSNSVWHIFMSFQVCI